MIFWLLLIVLLVGAGSGALYFSSRRRAARPDQYRAYVYACGLLFGVLPIASGEWPWSLLLLPLGLTAGRMVIRRKRR